MEIENQELSGYYTYRSFIDKPLPVNDFNNIKAAEAELFLIVQVNGVVAGTISLPAEQGASEKAFMDITGTVKSWFPEITLEFEGKGRPNTTIFDFLYIYSGSVTRTWENGIGQRLSLTGTEIRVQDHGSGEQIYKAGATASFVAVKRDFVEPRDINGVSIIPNALSMLASKSHRLIHATWHTIRLYDIWWLILNEMDKQKICDLNWGLDRHPFTKQGQLDLTNGSGEDFLFMHRLMITMVKDIYESQGVSYIESWKTIPIPSAQQFSYSEQEDPQNPAKKIYRLNPLESGYMIPPAYFISNGPESEQEDLEDLKSLKFLKSSSYFTSIMRYLERQFKDRRKLSSFSLGELGNLLEFVIHNQMHMRWSSAPIDPVTGKPPVNPETGKPTGRGSFDFNEKWDDPKYDYLGDFYSSHVNPVFWRLHGWVDDRIEDWFNAHEDSHPGEIERFELKGVSWFKPGKWVQVTKPFYWPENHDHHIGNESSIENMLKVMEIIEQAIQRSQERTDVRFLARKQVFNIMSFMQDILTNP
jgi:hypothetical protein